MSCALLNISKCSVAEQNPIHYIIWVFFCPINNYPVFPWNTDSRVHGSFLVHLVLHMDLLHFFGRPVKWSHLHEICSEHNTSEESQHSVGVSSWGRHFTSAYMKTTRNEDELMHQVHLPFLSCGVLIRMLKLPSKNNSISSFVYPQQHECRGHLS